MSNNLEKIVRPFQRGDVFNARVIAPVQPSHPAGDPNPVIDVIGAPDSHYVETDEPPGFGFDVEWKEDKTKRITEKVRVENKDDPDQFVVVERINQMVLANSRTAEEIKIKPDWSA